MEDRLIKFLVEGLFAGSLGLFGVAGNAVSIRVLGSSDLDMTPTFRHLLRMLAAFDATFLGLTVSLFSVAALFEGYDDYVRPWLIPYWLPAIQLALTGSVWTTMAVSIERYLTVCMGYRPNKVQHLFYTAPILLLSLLFNIPRCFELQTIIGPVNSTVVNETTGDQYNITREMPIVVPTELRTTPGYSRDYVVLANSFALCFIPFLILIVLNLLIYRTIAQATRLHNAISSNQRRDHSVAMMLIVIVVVFIFCHSIRIFINIYECLQIVKYGKIDVWPNWIQFMVHINHLALVVNSSINLLIYSCKDDKFLRVLLVTVGLRQRATRGGGRGRGGMGRSTSNNNNHLTATTRLRPSASSATTNEELLPTAMATTTLAAAASAAPSSCSLPNTPAVTHVVVVNGDADSKKRPVSSAVAAAAVPTTAGGGSAVGGCNGGGGLVTKLTITVGGGVVGPGGEEEEDRSDSYGDSYGESGGPAGGGAGGPVAEGDRAALLENGGTRGFSSASNGDGQSRC